ncbi:hypothetical protein ASD16_06465 [Cellulomonas sp. Root485]|uniref:hypothetical protein n=1 Tax=Cellulomonas sp. Root485 TaxID=1736546 RepID=UPI0006FCA628|nr:hypothetical protein [Cellulomonas sp. Root485]KQY25081.1 hypothetical protein ASD16_06465 [Cellulomonas sp. Root485]
MTSPTGTAPQRLAFDGHIAGFGTTEGTRIVVGRWRTSPLGSFSDVMVERADGLRVLLAPRDDVADLLAGTYVFDAVHVVPVGLRADEGRRRWRLRAGPLTADLSIGSRTRLGRLLVAVPRQHAVATLVATAADPFARLLLDGVRTRGTAGQGRREWYVAGDQHAITAVRALWGSADLGAVAPVVPAVRFGFSSVPAAPMVTRVRTIIEMSAGRTQPGH